MAATTSGKLAVTTPSDTKIVMTRVFDAPRELVFKAHTSCEHLRHWWGPREYVISVCENDMRVGGRWRVVHTNQAGEEFGFRGEYREIAPPERIVRTFEFDGAPGHVSVETLTLAERDGKTTLTTTDLFASKEDRDAMLGSGMERGATETMDRLESYLRAMAGQTLEISRVFDASLALVWKVWTEPDHVMQWWGPNNYSCPAARSDFRVGGDYLYCMRTPEGNDTWSGGTFREIVPMERIVATDHFADKDGNRIEASTYGLEGEWPEDLLVTITFEDLSGKTKLTLRHIGFPNEVKDMAGMAAEGWGQSLDKLAAYLAKQL